MSTILANKNHTALFRDLVRIFFSAARGVEKRELVCALPGGRSIVGFLGALRDLAPSLGGDILKRFHFFMVDERCVPLSSDESNFRLLQEQAFGTLLSAGLIADSQLHPYLYDPQAPDRGVARYEAELQRFGGAFDMTLLGVGEDAHVGALFPSHPSIEENGKLFFTFDGSPKPPPLRMTASAELIARSRFAAGLFLGEAKREAFLRFRDPAVPLRECPAKLLERVSDSYAVTDLI